MDSNNSNIVFNNLSSEIDSLKEGLRASYKSKVQGKLQTLKSEILGECSELTKYSKELDAYIDSINTMLTTDSIYATGANRLMLRSQNLDNFLRTYMFGISIWTFIQVIVLWTYANSWGNWISWNENKIYLLNKSLLIMKVAKHG